MVSPEDIVVVQNEDVHVNSSIYQPFSIEENIHQLNAIGQSIVQLMDHTATALNALTVPETSSIAGVSIDDANKPDIDPQSQKKACRSATDSFLATLHSVDVRMKRQVLALDEAGIVKLSDTSRQEPGGTATASLMPNGAGTVGNLDVGWLNSRSWRVEREMEAELWQDAREFLEKHGKNFKASN